MRGVGEEIRRGMLKYVSEGFENLETIKGKVCWDCQERPFFFVKLEGERL